MARTPKAAPVATSTTSGPRVVPLAEVAAIKAALPKGSALSTVTGGRGCPEGFAVVTIVEIA